MYSADYAKELEARFDRMVLVSRKWERLYAEAQAENVRHRNANLVHVVLEGVDDTVSDIIHAEGFDKVPWMVAEKTAAEAKRLRALISWIDGMLVDESDPMVIREGIYTALDGAAAACRTSTESGEP